MKRQSNIELLRVVSMFLILVVHVVYFSLGIPTQEMVVSSPVSSITHLFIMAVSFCAVDVFVIISGYFGIKPSKTKALSLGYISLFYPLVISILFCCLVGGGINWLRVFYLQPKSNWFVLSYFILFLLSPVLNAFVQNASKKELRNVIIAFYVFQSIFGWAGQSCVEYENGYSALSFIGIYLLGQYLKLYPESFKLKKGYGYLLFFIGSSLLITLISFVGIRLTQSPLRMFSYINPLVIVSSVSLFMFFKSLSFYSSVVNYVAKSTLAVLLIHTNWLVMPHYEQYVLTLYQQYDGLMCIGAFLISLIFIYVFCVISDQLRIISWNWLSGFKDHKKK